MNEDGVNKTIWACNNCQSIIETKEKDEIEVCSVCNKRTLEILGSKYGYERKQKCLEILKDPELFSKITEEELDKKIVGEIESRKVIFLCGAGGRLVENSNIASFNLLVNDEAGAGKDYVTAKTLELLPKEYYVKRTRISPAVLTYWNNKTSHPEWTWDGKVFYAEDISENVLNSEVFKVMCSSGSSATITIKQKAVDIEIEGKPVIITTTATATPNPELTRRFVILNLDSSEEQTTAIMKRKGEYAKTGIIPEYNKDYTYALRMLKRVKVRIPYADVLSETLPKKSIMMRTHFDRILDYMKASASFHQYQRKVDEEGFILATGQDYDIARECFMKLTSNKYMIPLTINQKKILRVFEENPKLKGHVNELNTNHIKGMSYGTLKEHLDKLVSYGILQTFLGKDTLNRDIKYYCLDGSYNPNEKIEIPTFEELKCRISKTTEITKTTKINKTTEITNENNKKEGDVSVVSVVSMKNAKTKLNFLDEKKHDLVNIHGWDQELFNQAKEVLEEIPEPPINNLEDYDVEY